MSIEREYGKSVLVCDYCGETVVFNYYEEAVNHKKVDGWESRKERGVWFDCCPDCVANERDEQGRIRSEFF